MAKPRGMIEIAILLLCVVVGFALAGGLVDTGYQTPLPSQAISNQIITNPHNNSGNSLQIQTINIQTTYGPLPPPGGDYCDPNFLQGYFHFVTNGSITAQEQDNLMSCVCNNESAGGNPTAYNTNCGTGDYSIGVFQINLRAHACIGVSGPVPLVPACNDLSNLSGVQACTSNTFPTASKSVSGVWSEPGGPANFPSTSLFEPIQNIENAVATANCHGTTCNWSAWDGDYPTCNANGQYDNILH